jgi:AraC-like DNA-binding protein
LFLSGAALQSVFLLSPAQEFDPVLSENGFVVEVHDRDTPIASQQLMSQSQLAYLRGCSELSAFTRAFKHWFGVAPSQWKRDPEK